MDTEKSKSDQLARYISDDMSPSERMEFEKQLQEDPALASELEAYEQGLEAVNIHGMRQQMDQLHEQHFNKRRNIPLRYYGIGAAASLLLWLGIQYVFFSQTSQDPAMLFQSYFEPYPSLEASVRGEETTLQEGLQHYTRQDYEQAIRHLMPLKDQPKAAFYLAISYLALYETQKAIGIMEEFQEASLYRPQLNWYLGLAYLQQGNEAAAVARLSQIQRGDFQYDEAREIISGLD